MDGVVAARPGLARMRKAGKPRTRGIISLYFARYRLLVIVDIAINIAMKTVVLTHRAAKQLDALPQSARKAVTAALILLATANQGDVKKLQGRDGYRLRVGAYRVIYEADTMTILAIVVARRTTTTY